MRKIYIFILRLLLSIILATVIGRFFFKEMEIYKTGLLAGIMLLLAYLFEYTKKRDGQKKDSE